MIVAVTGAAGHIGANLVRSLIKEGHKVRALIFQNRKALDGLNIQTEKVNLIDEESLQRAFAGIDIVYHLAASDSLASNNHAELEKINVIGTRYVVGSCMKCGVRRLVHFSSINALMQEPMNIPVDELRSLVDSKECPPYDLSKAAAEQEVRQGIELGLDAVILNPAGVIGPHDYQPSHFGTILLAMAQGKLPALMEGGFNWLDVRDVSSAAVSAAEKAPIGAKYLLSGHYATFKDLAGLVEQITGTPAPRLVLPSWMALSSAALLKTYNQISPGRPILNAEVFKSFSNCNPVISHQRASTELGFSPRPLKETLFDTLRWFEDSGFLDRSIRLKNIAKK